MGSPVRYQPTSFTNHGGTIGVQAGVSIVNGDIIMQQAHAPLSHLPNASDAPIYSSANQHEPLCLADTRVEILNVIEDWADGQDDRCIFWLSGLAGTGKSTIARTIAYKYHEEKKCLAASFFFSRGGSEDVRRAKRFVTSLAIQLAHNVEASKQLINEAISKHDDIANHSLREQWHHLILGPLSKLGNCISPTSLVLVVDALDECEDEDNICIIVQLLAETRALTKVRLRVLLTSRPEARIRSEFSRLQEKQLLVLHQVVLHDVPQLVISQDVELFLRHEFECYRQKEEIDIDWPDSEAITRLVQKSNGLFIWAATALRFICGGVDIDERLRMILEDERHERSPEAHLDNIYITVLQESLQGDYSEPERKKYCKDLRTLLGSIVTAFSLLSVEQLSKVLGFQQKYANRMLRGLHAILAIPADKSHPLRLHHPSFRDFLLSSRRCKDTKFLVDEKLAHRDLAIKCLRLMSSSLQQGSCAVDTVGTLVSEEEGANFKPCLPSELQYACQYWIQHLIRGGSELLDGDEVHGFLQKHCLHWLEVLGWMGKVAEGIHAISTLESTIPVRFVLYSRAAIEQAPLQVYCSALVFAPSGSIVKKQFTNKIPGWIKKLTQVDSSWSALLQTLEGHSGCAIVLAFSPNSRVLASGSYDGTLKLWDVGTGAQSQALESNTNNDTILDILFSPDSKLLVSASYDCSVKIWEVETGSVMLHMLSEGRVNSMAFSPDCKMLALIFKPVQDSKPTIIELWNVSTCEKEKRVNLPSEEAWKVTFLPEGTALALVSDNKTTSVLNLQTSKVMLIAESYGGRAATLSPNGKILASLSNKETVKLWGTATGAILQMLEHMDEVRELTFSPDGTLLASSSFDKIKLWNVGTGELVTMLENYWRFRPLIFSADSRALAFASSDTVELWKIETGVLHSFKGHLLVEALAFSPDCKVLASGFDDGTIQLWDAGMDVAGETEKDGFGPVQEVAFSPNGKVLMSISSHDLSEDDMIRLWNVPSGAEWDIRPSACGSVFEVAFSPDGKILALISQTPGHCIIDLWDVGTNEILQRLEDYSSHIRAVTFSPDSTWLASKIHGGIVKLWKLGTSEVLTLGGNYYMVTVAFSPNGKTLTLAFHNGVVELWDIERGELQYTLHHASVKAVAFSTDSGLLASISYPEISRLQAIDNGISLKEEVKLWNTSTGELLQTLWSSSDEFSARAFSSDGELLALEPGNGTLQMWDARVWNANLGAVPKTHPPDALLGRLWCGDRPAFLRTYSGPTSTGFSFSKSSPKQKGPPKVFISEQWIFYQGLRVLWLPLEYRPNCAAVYDDVVAIGRCSGAVSLLEISDTP